MSALANLAARGIAAVVSLPPVTDWLIRRAQRTPYTPITNKDGTEVYMGRWWLFNPYPGPGDYRRAGLRDWLPSVRIHHIMRADSDRHLHDHPWNARTFVLRGWYEEERPYTTVGRSDGLRDNPRGGWAWPLEFHHRPRGYTGRLLFGQYHRISAVSDGGVWTMFITWRWRGTWGFDVDGRKVPWREYLASQEGGAP